jgi:hypothetical protein
MPTACRRRRPASYRQCPDRRRQCARTVGTATSATRPVRAADNKVLVLRAHRPADFAVFPASGHTRPWLTALSRWRSPAKPSPRRPTSPSRCRSPDERSRYSQQAYARSGWPGKKIVTGNDGDQAHTGTVRGIYAPFESSSDGRHEMTTGAADSTAQGAVCRRRARGRRPRRQRRRDLYAPSRVPSAGTGAVSGGITGPSCSRTCVATGTRIANDRLRPLPSRRTIR